MTTARLGAGHCCACSRVCHHVGPARFCAEHKPQARVAVPAYVNAPPTVSGINGRDMGPVALAFIVRDLMAAAGYEYDPERPLADQSRECCDLIRTTTSEWHLALLAMSNDSQRHEAEEQRLTDLVDELRKHVEAKDHFIDKAVTQLADARRERDHARKQLGDAQANWVRMANRHGQADCDGGYQCAAREHIDGCLSGDVTIPKADADGG